MEGTIQYNNIVSSIAIVASMEQNRTLLNQMGVCMLRFWYSSGVKQSLHFLSHYNMSTLIKIHNHNNTQTNVIFCWTQNFVRLLT